MPHYQRREPETVEAYRLPLDRETTISDGMWLWLVEEEMPGRNHLQQMTAPGTWVVLSRGGSWRTMPDEEFQTIYKPLEG